MNANTGKKVGFFTDGGGGFHFAKAIILNIGILSLLWWIMMYFYDKGSYVAQVFVFFVFAATLGFTLKVWFYAIVAMILSKAVTDE